MREDYLCFRELYHSGIRGMKWGIRRYQNDDGTLTEAGKARYNDDGTRKNPSNMSLEDLNKSNQRINAENTYRNLTGTTQPGRSLNRDTAIKLGASFLGSAAASFLFRKFKTDHFIEPALSKKGKQKNIGKAVTTALISGTIGTLLATGGTLGANTYTDLPKEAAKKKVASVAQKAFSKV
jgi:hypothetical protein